MTNYPIADLIIQIKNAYLARHNQLTVPGSKLKQAILAVLKREGYIKDFKIKKTGPKTFIVITLKYTLDARNKPQPALQGVKLISKPGRRIYVGYDQIPPVLSGVGINILSTNKGILTGTQAQKAKVGGELICQVW